MSQRSKNRFLIQHSLKYETRQEALKEVKRIKSYLEYNAKKENWTYRAIVAISDKASLKGYWVKVKKRTPGRPEFKYVPYKWAAEQNNYQRKYHIHIMIEGIPGSTIANMIQDSINARVERVLGYKPNTFPINLQGKVFEKAYFRYFISQDPQPKIWGDDENEIFNNSWKKMLKDYWNKKS